VQSGVRGWCPWPLFCVSNDTPVLKLIQVEKEMTPEQRERYDRHSNVCWQIATETSVVTKEDPVLIYRRLMDKYAHEFENEPSESI
jgi:lipopolysaccharide export system protein LptC